MNNYRDHYTSRGFTLAELLIALAVLGVIATFTIPKVLDSGSNNQKNAAAKEVASMLSGAFMEYKRNNTLTANTYSTQFTPYMNYVAVKTDGSVNGMPIGPDPLTCNVNHTCLKLHNGGVLVLGTNVYFGSMDSTSVIYALFDPDGEHQATDGRAVSFNLYVTGRITTRGAVPPGTCCQGHTCACSGAVNPAYDPSWFSWSN